MKAAPCHTIGAPPHSRQVSPILPPRAKTSTLLLRLLALGQPRHVAPSPPLKVCLRHAPLRTCPLDREPRQRRPLHPPRHHQGLGVALPRRLLPAGGEPHHPGRIKLELRHGVRDHAREGGGPPLPPLLPHGVGRRGLRASPRGPRGRLPPRPSLWRAGGELLRDGDVPVRIRHLHPRLAAPRRPPGAPGHGGEPHDARRGCDLRDGGHWEVRRGPGDRLRRRGERGPWGVKHHWCVVLASYSCRHADVS
mmetsp:Transcript_34950/g.81912  ORF Transcript_34950/g.81912 Transcript_34950/m.81912 type:complete len:250 (-) Transcript_34950:246-995(-)